MRKREGGERGRGKGRGEKNERGKERKGGSIYHGCR